MGPLVGYGNDKMLINIVEKLVAYRVAVVTGEIVKKLLRVQILRVAVTPSNTGSAQTDAFVNLVNEWSVADKIKAFSFDTTSTNTGINSGACMLIMKKFNTNLLHLECLHQILEALVEKTFIVDLGPSSCPDIGLFKRF